jgi:hypothetical protein
MKSSYILSLLVAASIGPAIAQTSNDLWDVSQGTVITATSGPIPGYSIESMFGGGGDWAYFSDAQPPGFVHFVEWETPGDVKVAQIQLYAFGDGVFGFANNEREFSHFTLRAKSAGSLTYDVTVLEYSPTHPYTFIGGNGLIIDQSVAPVFSHSFRAEFTQYDTGSGFDGPRIVELDAFGPPPPVITAQPQGVVVNYAMPALFTVEGTGTGTGTLHYQWFKDGTPLAGQTSASLRIASATSNDMGAYMVGVTDDNGTTLSGPATLSIDFLNVQQSNADLFDVRGGIAITAHSPYYVPPTSGSDIGMFGGVTSAAESDWTYFADNQSTGTVHYVEWTTSNPVTLKSLRLFAHGDSGLNNEREFEKFTLKAKSPGSSTFDVVVTTFTPGHPYTFLDNELILDTEVTPVQASAFRAEFLQYTAGFGFDGPRIVELDGFATRPLVRPTIVVNPDSRTVSKNTQVTWKAVARGGSLHYQWKFMGQNISGATTDTFTIKHAKATDQGYYTVVVSNDAGTVESAQALLLVTH